MKELILQILLDKYNNISILLEWWGSMTVSDFIETTFPKLDLRRIKDSDYQLLKYTLIQLMEDLK